jgi:hypothetical protein
MSDIHRINEARRERRENALSEPRHLQALEDAADALEGIRQDLTELLTYAKDLIQILQQSKR